MSNKKRLKITSVILTLALVSTMSACVSNRGIEKTLEDQLSEKYNTEIKIEDFGASTAGGYEGTAYVVNNKELTFDVFTPSDVNEVNDTYKSALMASKVQEMLGSVIDCDFEAVVDVPIGGDNYEEGMNLQEYINDNYSRIEVSLVVNKDTVSQTSLQSFYSIVQNVNNSLGSCDGYISMYITDSEGIKQIRDKFKDNGYDRMTPFESAVAMNVVLDICGDGFYTNVENGIMEDGFNDFSSALGYKI